MTVRQPRRWIVAWAGMLLLCGWSPLDSGALAQGREDTSRQILVLVRISPEHARASSGYGGGADYGDELARSGRLRLAARIAHAHGLKLVDDWPMPLLGMGCLVMAVPAGTSPEQVAGEVAKDRGVVFAQPEHDFSARNAVAAGGDPLLPAQAGARQWRLEGLHQLATGRGVLIAVIDSAIDQAHPDLVGQIAVARDFASAGASAAASAAERHGTAVAGVIAARAGNGMGIVGVAPGARLMALRACREGTGAEPATACDSVSLDKAIYFAIEHGAQIINLSLAGPQDRLMAQLLDLAMARGASVIAAYAPDLPAGGFPASLPGVIAVSDHAVSGAGPAYYAPGGDVLTTLPHGRWGLVSGSSFAAAHVSGLVALVRERKRLHDGEFGGKLASILTREEGGQIDACATLLRGHQDCHCLCATPQSAVRTR